jgi:GTPase Era involved in 16S rRNA processing
MTVAATPDQPVLTRAIEVVDIGVAACTAYGRADLAARLGAARRPLADPSVHVVIAGEFKQGKSSLVNGLLGANICPVDDDVATALPTYVRYGAEPRSSLVFDEDPPRRQTIPLDDIRRYVVEYGDPGPHDGRIVGVEIELPRKILAGGLVLVDTPGVGGLGSSHAAASLAATSMADAVIFVTDASQELTRSELDFVGQAQELCRTVVCVMTKTDFYPAWRTIRDLNQGHLRSVIDTPLMAVSSSLRALAVKGNDKALNTESGFAEVVRFVSERVGTGAADRMAADAAAEVVAVCEQIMAQFQAEREALADPAAAQRVVDQLSTAKQRVETLRSAAAKWSQTLNDGIADLNADIDHDLRARIRDILQEADDSMENADPADAWPQMESWIESRVSYDLLANYRLLRVRADALSEEVAEHFRAASGEVFNQLAVFNPTARLSGTRVEHKIELEKMKTGKKAMVMLKSAYGGTLMFTMLASMAGIALGPISIGIGLVMGHKGLREEKKRQLLQRRQQAKNAVRRYCDEVSFVMGKDSRDTLRRIQRQLRDHYSGLAEELSRSNAEALTGATEAAKRTQASRESRLRDLDAELARLSQLRQRAQTVGAA